MRPSLLKEHLEWGRGIPILQVGILSLGAVGGLQIGAEQGG